LRLGSGNLRAARDVVRGEITATARRDACPGVPSGGARSLDFHRCHRSF
jgi:hypothetical protein